MLTDTDVSTVAHIIQLAVAPVFLITGVGSILGVLVNRLARIVDRARRIEERLPDTPATERAPLRIELRRLAKRARLIHWAITLCISSALLVCTVVAALFIGDFITLDMAELIATLFITAMSLLITALLCFLREIYLAVMGLRIGMQMEPGEM
jgi:hypothetical protein